MDGEKELVMLLEDELKAKGYEVLAAYDGENGIELAKNQPDLIILDITYSNSIFTSPKDIPVESTAHSFLPISKLTIAQ